MTSKSTPGPWRVEAGTTLIWGACDRSDTTSYGMGDPIADARITPSNPRWAGGPNEDEGEANSYLIAAAPDLIEALEEAPLLSKYHGRTGFDVEQFIADYSFFLALKRAALAKARGKST